MSPRPKLLDEEAVGAALAGVPEWTRAGDSIERTFRFDSFSAAFAFMTRAAMAAEQLDHHPDWSNVYDRVEVRLTTHDAGGLTESDFELARRIDGFAHPGSA